MAGHSGDVFIVCSAGARTGVTTTARLLTDYRLFSRAPVAGFDTDPHEPRYGALFPDLVKTVDVADIKGQIALFDRLLAQDGVTKIVDVWHRGFQRFFATVQDIGFIEEARRNGIEPILLFHADVTEAALASAQRLHATWPALPMIVVQNEGARPLGPDAADILRRYPAQHKFFVAALPGPLANALDDPSLSLSRFLLAPPTNMSIVVRAALKSWIVPIFTQFKSFELRRELESSDYLR
jgi:hypothetical protein